MGLEQVTVLFQTEHFVHTSDLSCHRVKLSLLIINPGGWILTQSVECFPLTLSFYVVWICIFLI